MHKFVPILSSFALAALTVTPAHADQQHDCLSKLAKEWDKSATFLTSRETIMKSTSAAFLVPRDDSSTPSVLIVDSAIGSGHFYDNAGITPENFSAESIDDIGILKGHRPDRVLGPEREPKIATIQAGLKNCLNLK